MANKKKLTREERLEKKRIAERERYQRIKNDREKYEEQKEKERQKFKKKKEKGIIKTVKQMSPREQRKARKIWREKARERRHRLALQNINNIAPVTPPSSDNEAPPPPRSPSNEHWRLQEGKRRSRMARRTRNAKLKAKSNEIARLKAIIDRYKKRLQRVSEPSKKKPTPNTKVTELLESPSSRDTIRKKLLFGEVLSEQLKENYSALKTKKDKRIFKRIISGKIVKRYGVLKTENILKPLRNLKPKLSLEDPKRNVKKNIDILKTRIEKFMEEDSNSRLCAGKKDFVTKQGDRKQKRIMLDTLLNLHKLFMKNSGIAISYSAFCRFRPYWIVPPRCDNRDTCLCKIHGNMDLILKALHRANIISTANHVGLLNSICCNRYNEKCLSRDCQACKNKGPHYKEFDNSVVLSYEKWESVRQDFVDPKTNKIRKVSNWVKSKLEIHPRDLILDLESKLEPFLLHELNIVHQYMALKAKKETLTEKDALIHVDFSENYQTKYAEEIQAFHFGGSRQQVSMHTVVVYTKEGEELKTSCFYTLSKNLSHSPPAIWAHLQPILNRLPSDVNNLHFLSDGPVTQYRNKIMFQVLATMLREFYPNVINFTWNYHEVGHGKGAPDGVGATCKRIADRVVGSGSDISSMEELTDALQKGCPNINIFIIDNSEILAKEAQIASAANAKTFTGTLKVHQVTGSVFLPHRLVMKSLSCFCDPDFCCHFVMGTVDYPAINPGPRLHVNDVYESESDSDDEPLALSKQIKDISKESPQAPNISCSNTTPHKDDQQPSTSQKSFYKNGDFVLVKLLHRQTEYRYVAMCTGVEEDDEIQVIFCKISDDTGRHFKIDQDDISFIQWDQILEDLPIPNLKMKGQRILYAFNKSINVFERA